MSTDSSYCKRKRMLWGGLLIGFGAVALLDRMAMLQIQSIGHYWPFILVLAGINNLLEYPEQKYVLRGMWLIFLGVWLFVSLQQIWASSSSIPGRFS